jgi:glycosyltransferase involved in cell wall biosynthesis
MYKVSVIITCYNYKAYVGEAILSVLGQTYQPYEIIVVDDGSTDGSADEISRFSGVTLIKQENKGPGAALNTGIKAASGDAIALLDADDYWAPNKLERQIEVLKALPSNYMCFTLTKQFVSPELSEQERAKCTILQEIMVGESKISILASMQLVEKVGLFDETLATGDFIEWYARAMRVGMQKEVIHEVLTYRRVKPNSLSQRATQRNHTLLEIFRAHLNAKRNE